MRSSSLILSDGRFLIDSNFESCSIRIVDGVIRDIAPSLIPGRDETIVPLDGAVVLPGLINAHDHLEFDLFEKIGAPPYQDYVEWGEDIHNHHKDHIRQVLQVPLRLRLLWGAYKNIFSGVTTVVHHNDFYFHFRYGFPIEIFRHYTWIHSLALDRQLQKKLRSLNSRPAIIHIAEGVNDLARSETELLRRLGGLTSKTVLVHGIRISDIDIAFIEKAGASLVWCPSSNLFLYHQTAPVEKAFDRIRVALGTDSTLTGNASLFDEIRLAMRSKPVDASRALAMVTSVPASIFGMNKGAIAIGKAADLLLYDCAGDPLKGFSELTAGTVRCLLRSGTPVYGDAETVLLFRPIKRAYSSLRTLGREKMIRGNLHQLVSRISRHLPSFNFNGLPVELEPAS